MHFLLLYRFHRKKGGVGGGGVASSPMSTFLEEAYDLSLLLHTQLPVH